MKYGLFDLQCFMDLFRGLGYKKAPAFFIHGVSDLDHLFFGLACSKYHLRHTLSQMPVMIRFRERQVFIWEVPQLFRGVLRRKFSGPHRVQDFLYLMEMHERLP